MNYDLQFIGLVVGTIIVSSILFIIWSEIQIKLYKNFWVKEKNTLLTTLIKQTPKTAPVNTETTCPYCCFKNDVGKIINNAGDDFTIMKHDNEEHFSLVTGTHECHILKINYCPVCGRDLTVNNSSTGQ